MAVADDVLAANRAFYVAFAERDVGAMEQLWAKSAPIACIHPGWAALLGRPRVVASWIAILRSGGAPRVSCSDATAHVLGEAAFVTCVEHLAGARLVATNVFIREDGHWRLVHHQSAPASPSAFDDAPDGGESEDDEPPKTGGSTLN